MTSEGAKNFFKKHLEVSKKVVPLQRSSLAGFFVSAYHIKIFEYSQREGVAI
nr:MAG TPA: hypothetical protein [Caudoviricetes sp.]